MYWETGRRAGEPRHLLHGRRAGACQRRSCPQDRSRSVVQSRRGRRDCAGPRWRLGGEGSGTGPTAA